MGVGDREEEIWVPSLLQLGQVLSTWTDGTPGQLLVR